MESQGEGPTNLLIPSRHSESGRRVVYGWQFGRRAEVRGTLVNGGATPDNRCHDVEGWVALEPRLSSLLICTGQVLTHHLKIGNLKPVLLAHAARLASRKEPPFAARRA